MGEHTQLGDALRAEKVIARARRIGDPKLIQLSGQHKGRELALRDSVYCVIAIPLKALQRKNP